MSVLRVPRALVKALAGYGFPGKKKHLQATINPGIFQTNRNTFEKAKAQTGGEKTEIALNTAPCVVALTEENGLRL